MLETSSLTSLDVIVFTTCMLISVAIGLYFSRKTKSFEDYATGGGDQNLWAVSFSMALNYTSAMTLIQNPTELYLHGSSFALSMMVVFLGWPVTSFILLPVFKQLNSVSVFKYLELRYSSHFKQLTSAIFLINTCLFSAIMLYLPGLSLEAMLGIPHRLTVVVVGALCVICSSLGGLKGVTWTNLYHSFLVMTVILLILVGGIVDLGGVSKFWSQSMASGRLSLGENFFTFDLNSRHTIFNIILGYTCARTFMHGVAQSQVQSALSLSSLKRAQMSQFLSAAIYVTIQILSSSVGLLFYPSYQDGDPYDGGKIIRRDAILIHYIHTKLSFIPAIQGLFIVAVFSATFSAVSGNQTSSTSMIIEDFVKPGLARRKKIMSDHLGSKLVKVISIAWGIVTIAAAFYMHQLDSLLQVGSYFYAVFGVPVLVAFLLGVLTEFTNTTGVLCGILSSLVFGLNIIRNKLLHSHQTQPSLPLMSKGGLMGSPVKFYSGNSTTQIVDIMSVEILGEIVDLPSETNELFKGNEDFSNLLDISYMWVPFFSAIITLIVAIVVSLLTGGARQTVDESLLTPFVHKYYRRDKKPSKWNLDNIGDKLQRYTQSPEDLPNGFMV